MKLIENITIPKYVWLKMLSNLDSRSLRNCLLVNKKWYEYASSESLNYLSKRDPLLMANVKKYINFNPIERLKYFAFGDLKELLEISKFLKEDTYSIFQKSLFIFSIFFSFFPSFLIHIKAGGLSIFFFFFQFFFFFTHFKKIFFFFFKDMDFFIF